MLSSWNGRLTLSLLLCGLLALSLVGCDGDDATQAEDVAPVVVATPPGGEGVAEGEPEAVAAEGDGDVPADATDDGRADAPLNGIVELDLPTIDGVVADGEYAHTASIARMSIHWSNDAETLFLAMVAPGRGYVAVGFDPVSRKVGANYILGWVDEDGASLRDHVGTRGNLHEPDTALGGTDDIIEFAGAESDRATTIEFAIPLDSGDALDRPLVAGNSYVLHAAYHRSRDDDFSTHTGWGIGELALDAVP